jgi:hypothetical protein
MYDRQFFRTKLGKAALLSIMAMLAVNIVALDAQLHEPANAAALQAEVT